MLIKTILNKCEKFKSFVYEKVAFVTHLGQEVIEVTIKPRENSKPICSNCMRPSYG